MANTFERFEGLSRRSFVKAGVAGIAALGALGVAGAAFAEGEGASASQEAAGDSSAFVAPESADGAWTFVDQGDNEVTVQIPVQRIVCMQHHSLDMLCQLGQQDKVVGTEAKWQSDLGDYMLDVFPGIEDVATPGDLTDWNVEELVELKPDVVIAASQANEDAMKRVRDLGIPVVMVSLRGEGKQAEAQSPRLADADAAYTEGCEWAVKTLGALTGSLDKANEIWDFCCASRETVDEAVGDIADDERVRAFVPMRDDKTYGNDKYGSSGVYVGWQTHKRA